MGGVVVARARPLWRSDIRTCRVLPTYLNIEGPYMATDTVPARWDSDTSTKLAFLRDTTGRTVSWMVGYAISIAAADCVGDPDLLVPYFAPLARRANAVRTSVTLTTSAARHLQTVAELHDQNGQTRSRYAIARACVRRWLDRDLDALARSLGAPGLAAVRLDDVREAANG